MSVSIDLHVYDRYYLVKDIDEYVMNNGGYREGVQQPGDFLDTVGSSFGVLTEDKFFVVWNEYFEDYNPGANFLQCVDDYYFPRNRENNFLYAFWSNNFKTESEGAISSEVLSQCFPEEFGYQYE